MTVGGNTMSLSEGAEIGHEKIEDHLKRGLSRRSPRLTLTPGSIFLKEYHAAKVIQSWHGMHWHFIFIPDRLSTN
jgi:hypothetical protein